MEIFKFSYLIRRFSFINSEWRVLGLGIIAFSFTTFFIFLFLPFNRALDLLGYFVYLTAGTTFLPLPTPQWVMAYGMLFSPILLAFVGGIGTSIAHLPDYPLVSYAFRFKKIAMIKTSKTYDSSIQLFNKMPFITLLIAAFTPIPFEPFRLLAASSRYNLENLTNIFNLNDCGDDVFLIRTFFLIGNKKS